MSGRIWDSQRTIRSEADVVRNNLKTAVLRIPVWSALGDPTIKGIVAICRVASDKAISIRVIDAVRKRLEGETDPQVEVILGLGVLCGEVEALGHGDALEQPFILPGAASTWIGLSSTIMKVEKQWRSLITVRVNFVDVSGMLCALVSDGEFAQVQFEGSVLPLAKEQFGKRTWDAFNQAIAERLKSGQPTTAAEVRNLLNALWNIRTDGCQAAGDTLNSLANDGSLLSLLSVHESDTACTAWCVVSLLSQQPSAPLPTSRLPQAQAGYRTLVQRLEQGDQKLAHEILDVLHTTHNTDFLFEVVDSRPSYDPLIVECLRLAATTSPREFIPTASLLMRWKGLKDNLGEVAFQELVQKLVEEAELDRIVEAQNAFNIENADLYTLIFRTSPSTAFVQWVQRGLEAVEKGQWIVELGNPGSLLNLALLIAPRQGSFLGSDFQDAIVQHAQEVAKGDWTPHPQFNPQKTFELLETASRKLLPGRLLREGIPQDGDCADAFFELYGDLISDVEALRAEPKIIVRLFSRLIEDRKVGGLRWLKVLLTRNPSLLDVGFEPESVYDFRGRLENEWARTTADDAHAFIIEIAEALGITPKSTEHSEGEQLAN
jgi:hypothetical protein